MRPASKLKAAHGNFCNPNVQLQIDHSYIIIFLGFIFKIVMEKFSKIGEAVAAVAN